MVAQTVAWRVETMAAWLAGSTVAPMVAWTVAWMVVSMAASKAASSADC